jgi:hypothetical protein
MVKCCVFFAVRTEYLNIIYMGFGFTTYHPNVFTLILSLSDGRAGTAWEPSNYMMLFLPPPPPPRNKVSLTSAPNIFSLLLLFCYPSDLSLSLRLQRTI